MAVVNVFGSQDIQELLQKIAAQEKRIAELEAAIAEKQAKLEEIRKRKEAPSVQPDEQRNKENKNLVECSNGQVDDNSLSSSTASMFGKNESRALLSTLGPAVNTNSTVNMSEGPGSSN